MPHHHNIALLEDNSKHLEKLEAYLSKIPNARIVLRILQKLKNNY
ncbi:hypothetical protein SD427_08565 [Chryseobacterium sp. JJR-5R]|nr:hypothetical protein [Chryseobacterium sp. JJR-5R]WPO84375.1 hypothetical protein SD427_08565 [Chryseobacterium sp. JJR-5R]